MILQILPWAVCLLLAVLAYVLKFHLMGYSFSALVCCICIGIILFYTLTHRFQPRFPAAMGLLRRVVTIFLAAVLAVSLATEAVILRYSLGSTREPVDYVVVLGAKVRPTGPSMSLWDRIYGAERYLKAHPEVIAVVSGGQGTDEPLPEALAMYYELTELGIDPARILVEDRATSTWENLNFSLDLIEETTGQRPEKIGVVSSEYHLFRASLFARECGVEFVGIPAKTSRMGQKINHFIREVAGVWHFLILGGQYDQ